MVETKVDILKDTIKAGMEAMELQSVELPTGTWSIERKNGRYGPYTTLNWKNRVDDTKRKRWDKKADVEGAA